MKRPPSEWGGLARLMMASWDRLDAAVDEIDRDLIRGPAPEDVQRIAAQARLFEVQQDLTFWPHAGEQACAVLALGKGL